MNIQGELVPFFRYANQENPSVNISTWTDSEGRVRTHKAYQNCVSCNVHRFYGDVARTDLLARTDTYFCTPCYKKLAGIVKKYDTGTFTEEYKSFMKIVNDFLFQSKL